MNDTHPEIEKKFQEMLMKKSPQERLRMGCEMFDAAKQIVVSSLRQENPNISPAELRQKVFLRFYKDDFTPAQLEKILARL